MPTERAGTWSFQCHRSWPPERCGEGVGTSQTALAALGRSWRYEGVSWQSRCCRDKNKVGGAGSAADTMRPSCTVGLVGASATEAARTKFFCHSRLSCCYWPDIERRRRDGAEAEARMKHETGQVCAARRTLDAGRTEFVGAGEEAHGKRRADSRAAICSGGVGGLGEQPFRRIGERTVLYKPGMDG